MKTKDKEKAIDYALDNIIVNPEDIIKWENIKLKLTMDDLFLKKSHDVVKTAQKALFYFKTVEKTIEAIDFFISDIIHTKSCIDFWKEVKIVYKYNKFDGLPPKEYLLNEKSSIIPNRGF